MEAINHLPFIVGSYAAAFIVVAVLVGWVTIDFRTQRRALADLEMRGVTRRSAAAPAGAALAQAKEKA
jgi:heme exporter protein D